MPVPRSSTDRVRASLCALLVAACLAHTAHAQATPLTGAARWADSARVLIERGVMAHDSMMIARAGAMLEKSMTAFPDDPLLLHYRGYGLYREAMFAAADEMADGTKRALELAIDVLRRSAKGKPMPETYALLGSCMGSLAGTGITGGMKWGAPAGEATETARTMGPRNPRVLLLEGIGKWYTPTMWGGGKDKGYALMQRAVAAFEGDAPSRPLPAWGMAEAYAWLGQMETQRGRIAEARAAYERALAIEPAYSWVRNELLPKLAAR